MNTVPGLGRNTFAVYAGPLPANPERPEKLSCDPSRSQAAPGSRRGVYVATARRSRRAEGSRGREVDRAVSGEPDFLQAARSFLLESGSFPGQETKPWNAKRLHAISCDRIFGSFVGMVQGSVARSWKTVNRMGPFMVPTGRRSLWNQSRPCERPVPGGSTHFRRNPCTLSANLQKIIG